MRDLDQETRNKALVLEAFDALFNRRDFEAAERYWSANYIQHSVGIGPGLDGLVALVRSVRRRYESALAVAEGEYVMVHGRFSGGGRPTKIVVDGVVEVRDIRHVFLMTGAVPNTRWLEGCVALDSQDS